jgi:hypothetical protein
MKALDIITHLMEHLPRHTDKFTDFFESEGASIAGPVVTITKTAHGLQTGHVVSVTDGAFLNPVASLADVTGGVQVVTTEKHDISYGWQGQVYLTSATDPSVDAWYDVVSVQSNLIFTIASFPDVALTDVVLHEYREVGINGLFAVSVVDVDTFTYTLDTDPGLTLALDSKVKIHNKLRISGASTIERCAKAYEKQSPDDMWGFVILGENAISKSRFANTDSDKQLVKYLSHAVFFLRICSNRKQNHRPRGT